MKKPGLYMRHESLYLNDIVEAADHLLANLCLLFFSRLLAELFKEGADAGEAAR